MGNAWRRFVACDAELVVAGQQLLKSDHGPVLLEALKGGEEFLAAVNFIARYRPHPFVVNALDLLLPLAIQGGIEQVDVAEVVETADRVAVRSALGTLVERVLLGSGDQYLEFAGLLELLDRLGEAVLLRRVVDAARHSDDPEVRELVADHAPRTAAISGGQRPPMCRARPLRGHSKHCDGMPAPGGRTTPSCSR